MKKSLLVLAAFAPIFSASQVFAAEIETQAKLNSATIFRSGAMLQQKANVNIPAGTHTITIYNVAQQMNEQTIRLNIPDNIQILSIKPTQVYNKGNDQKSEEYKALYAKLKTAKATQNTMANDIAAEQLALDILKSNQAVGGQTAVQTADVQKMIDYQKKTFFAAKAKIAQLTLEKKEIDEEVTALQSQLNNLGESGATYSGALILNVVSTATKNVQFDIEYLTDNAYWASSYDVRSEGVGQTINLVQNASISQTTGINWSNIDLTLSTGNPYTNSTIPTMGTWYIPYEGVQMYKNTGVAMTAVRSKARLETADKVAAAPASLDNYLVVDDQSLNVSYNIKLPYTIPSTGKAYNVALNSLSLKGEYEYYAAPRLSPSAYVKANIKDFEKYNLTDGNANIYFEKFLVGQTYLNFNNTGDSLALGLGIDPKIKIERKKVDNLTATTTIGTNRRYNVGYEIKVKNTKSQAVTMIVEDQIPVSRDNRVSVDLQDKGGATLDEATGKLQWKITIPAGQTQTIKYNYQVKAPKDMSINL